MFYTIPKSLKNFVIKRKQYVLWASIEETCAETRTFPIYHSLWGKFMFLSTDTKRIYLKLHAFFICLHIESTKVLVSAILHHSSLLRLLHKSYFKIISFQPNFLCSCSFNYCIVTLDACASLVALLLLEIALFWFRKNYLCYVHF